MCWDEEMGCIGGHGGKPRSVWTGLWGVKGRGRVARASGAG